MSKLILPGLIDPHVHLREPGNTQKEDFYTGTTAALAGGYTTIMDMPNNNPPATTLERIEEKISLAKKKIVCDVGFHFGSLGDNLNEFSKVKHKVIGLKLYFNQTTGGYVIPKEKARKVFQKWPRNKIILIHVEDEIFDFILDLAKEFGNRIHICHVAQKEQLKKIIKAKEKRLSVTCGVTPYSLFLTRDDLEGLGPFGLIKPPLRTKEDQDFLWANLPYIDVIESDHAPHTVEEKKSASPPWGIPGVETTLPILLTAIYHGRLTINQLTKLCFENPAKIFGIKTDPKTKIEIDTDKEWTIRNKNLFTKAKWSPFNNWKVKGKVIKVFIRGKKVFENGKILVKPGFGKIVPNRQ